MPTNTFWLKFGGLSLAVTLEIRSRSPKSIQLFIMSKCYIHANLIKICQLVHEILCTQASFGSNLAVLSPAVTLKNRSRSPKLNQLFIMSQCCIHANLVEICQSVNEIWCTQAHFCLNLAVLSPAVTLKIRSRSLKLNQLFIMSQCYVCANLVKIHWFMRYCAKKKVSRWHLRDPHQKQYALIPFGGGHYNQQSQTLFKKAHTHTWYFYPQTEEL